MSNAAPRSRALDDAAPSSERDSIQLLSQTTLHEGQDHAAPEKRPGAAANGPAATVSGSLSDRGARSRTFILSFLFLVLFSVSNVNQGLLTTLFPTSGFIAFCLLSGSLALGSIVAPSVAARIPVNWCLAGVSTLHLFRFAVVAIFGQPDRSLPPANPLPLYIASVLSGFAASVFWVSQGRYVTQMAAAVNVGSKWTSSKITATFWAVFGGNVVGGQILVLALLVTGAMTTKGVLWTMTSVGAVAAIGFATLVRPIPAKRKVSGQSMTVTSNQGEGEPQGEQLEPFFQCVGHRFVVMLKLLFTDRTILGVGPMSLYTGACYTFSSAVLPALSLPKGAVPKVVAPDTATTRVACLLLIFGVANIFSGFLLAHFLPDAKARPRARLAVALTAHTALSLTSWIGLFVPAVPGSLGPGVAPVRAAGVFPLAELWPQVVAATCLGALDTLQMTLTNSAVSLAFRDKARQRDAPSAFAAYRLWRSAGVVTTSILSLFYIQPLSPRIEWVPIVAWLATTWFVAVTAFAWMSWPAARKGRTGRGESDDVERTQLSSVTAKDEDEE